MSIEFKPEAVDEVGMLEIGFYTVWFDGSVEVDGQRVAFQLKKGEMTAYLGLTITVGGIDLRERIDISEVVGQWINDAVARRK